MDIDPKVMESWPPEAVALIRALMAEVAELKRRLGMNSSNSSKPPSSDALNKSKPSSEDGEKRRPNRTPKTKRTGKTRNDFGTPDKVVPVRPDDCPDCGAGLVGDEAVYDRRQVAELVDKPFIVTEYQFFRGVCPCCGKVVDAPEAEGTLPGFCLGPKLVAFIGLLDHHGNLSYEKTSTILSEAFGLPICEGTIDNANQWLHAGLAAPVSELKETLPKLPHVHGDESGWGINGLKHWVWVLATKSMTFLHIAPSRGAKVLVELLSGAFKGLISCDFYNAYRSKDGVGGERTYCWAHLDREAKAIIDNGEGETKRFGRALRRFINKGYIHWRGLKRGRISVELFQKLGARLKLKMKDLLAECEGRLSGKKPIALHKRLGVNIDGYFNWYNYPGVPPDNSLAERAIRPIVVNRKVSGGNRSQWGAELTASMHTVIGTLRKQGRPIMETLTAYLLAIAHPGLSYPTLIPASLSAAR